jgi:hypothetical protein
MNCSCWDKLSLDENEVNDDEDTEIEIMRPKRGLDQNDKTNQTPVNEKSGNSESKSKSEEEAERKENVNIEAADIFTRGVNILFNLFASCIFVSVSNV